jgi:hypothetical protein
MNKRHNNRRFRLDSYKRNDAKAKTALSIHLINEGYFIEELKEDYKFDLSVSIDKETQFGTLPFQELYEVEIKNQWGDKWNPDWTEIRIPERKKRLITLWRKDYPERPFTFVILNTTVDQGWFIPAETVEKSRVGTIQNSRRIGSPHLKEPFFHIPMEQAVLKKLNINEKND